MTERGYRPPGLAVPDLADTVRRHRTAASLTQHQLADRAGVSTATIRDIEQRRTLRPHPASLPAGIDGNVKYWFANGGAWSAEQTVPASAV
jgi:hypothetical protein